MKPTTAIAVETYLFDRETWVEELFLCSHFEVSARALRRMLAGVGVMAEGRWLHVHHASQEELEGYCGPKQAHAVTEWKNIRQLRLNHRHRRRPYLLIMQPELLP